MVDWRRADMPDGNGGILFPDVACWWNGRDDDGSAGGDGMIFVGILIWRIIIFKRVLNQVGGGLVVLELKKNRESNNKTREGMKCER